MSGFLFCIRCLFSINVIHKAKRILKIPSKRENDRRNSWLHSEYNSSAKCKYTARHPSKHINRASIRSFQLKSPAGNDISPEDSGETGRQFASFIKKSNKQESLLSVWQAQVVLSSPRAMLLWRVPKGIDPSATSVRRRYLWNSVSIPLMQLCSIDETGLQLKGNHMVRMETPETELCKCRGITPKKCFGSVHEAHIACRLWLRSPPPRN